METLLNLISRPVYAQANSDDPATLSGLETVFSNVLSAAIALAGVALFIMLIMGGYKYIMAGSDSKSAESAKNTITYAIYGVVLLALSYLILRIIANFTGVNEILNFQVTVNS